MLISPPPQSPCPFLYSADEFAILQANHLVAFAAWERDANRVMWLNAVPVICVCIGVVIAAFLGPSIVLDAISVLVR